MVPVFESPLKNKKFVDIWRNNFKKEYKIKKNLWSDKLLNKEVDQYLSFKILSLVRFKECFVKIDTMLNLDLLCP